MTVHNYNGAGRWSVEAVQSRYQRYAHQHGLVSRLDLAPREHVDGDNRWIYPVMDAVIAGIEKGDPGCADIGIEFMEESASFPFGMTLKASTARALRRAALNSEQKERIRNRVVEMLRTGYLPREFRQYAKLARSIGMGGRLAELEAMDRADPWVRRYCEYLMGG